MYYDTRAAKIMIKKAKMLSKLTPEGMERINNVHSIRSANNLQLPTVNIL